MGRNMAQLSTEVFTNLNSHSFIQDISSRRVCFLSLDDTKSDRCYVNVARKSTKIKIQTLKMIGHISEVVMITSVPEIS